MLRESTYRFRWLVVPQDQQGEIGGNFALCLPPRGLLSVGAGPGVGQCRLGPAFLAARGSQQAAAAALSGPLLIPQAPRIAPQWFASLQVDLFSNPGDF